MSAAAPVVAGVAMAAFTGLVLAAAGRDLTSFTIPNWISGALCAVFLIAAPFVMPIGTVGWHLTTFIAALTLGFAMFSWGWIGGGDAKLFAAIALWAGWPYAASFVIATALAGGALTLALVVARRLAPALPGGVGWTASLLDPKSQVPYGVALAAGGLAILPASAFAAAF